MMYRKNNNSSIYMPKQRGMQTFCSEEDAVEESIAYSNGGEEGSENKSVTAENNHIYFYEEVHRSSILALIKILNKMNFELKGMAEAFQQKPPPIILHINSYGGVATDCFNAVDHIIGSKIPVYTIVEGLSASAGTIMSIVGKRRFIRKNARMLIHSVQSGFWGNFQQIEDEKENIDQLMETLKSFYIKYTKISGEDLDEILRHDLHWDSKKCLEVGLVDKIL